MQDFLTCLIVATFIASVIYFALSFVLSLSDYEQRIRNRGTDLVLVPVPAPLVSVKELDRSLESQIKVPAAPAFTPLHRPAQLAITKPVQLAITTRSSRYPQGVAQKVLITAVHAAPAAAPIVSVEQIDRNFDPQIDALLLAQQFPLLCRSLLTPARRPTPIALPSIPVEQADQMECHTLLTSPTAPAKNKSPRKAKAKNITQPATTTRSSRYPQGVAPKSTQNTHKKPSVTVLRTLCTKNEIKWRNVYGKDQHYLNQDEMIAALTSKSLTL